MLGLTRLGLSSSYAADILPSLIVMGVGTGLVFSTSMNNATLGVAAKDAGVASAMVSASQQIGGSLGTALLSTIATSAATSFIVSAHAIPTRGLIAHAAIHGYTTGFAVAAGMFVAGAVIAGLLFDRGVSQPVAVGEPVLAH
jgi:hypothetical protein